MTDIVCQCIYKTFIEKSVSLSTTALDFLLSMTIGVAGITINYTFLKKLREEKRKTPLGRKGNVIEPIMRWFCIVQMFYWPYHLTYFWLNFNEVIPTEYMNGWWCNVLTLTVKLGRVCVAFNSLFVALIRYIYIVHHQKSNQWEFEKVGKLFRISSIAVPVCIEVLGIFVNPHKMWQNQNGFVECIADNLGLNTTDNLQIPPPCPLAWTIKVIPEPVISATYYVYFAVWVVISFNVAEFFFYFQIHRSIKR